MHFWIDKRSQGCGYNGRHRYRIPPSLSGPPRSQRLLCGGVHPKLMVTPVHRFQSIESVATGGMRHSRTSSYRFPFVNSSVNYNASARAYRNRTESVQHSMEVQVQVQTETPRGQNNNTAKCKSILFLFATITFVSAGAKFYLHGANMGVEALAFCSLLVVILIVGGLLNLYEAFNKKAPRPNSAENNTVNANQTSSEQLETIEENANNVPNNATTAQTVLQTELPPPPYHIAIMLPSQNDPETIEIIRDSPPPSYDKAVT